MQGGAGEFPTVSLAERDAVDLTGGIVHNKKSDETIIVSLALYAKKEGRKHLNRSTKLHQSACEPRKQCLCSGDTDTEPTANQ